MTNVLRAGVLAAAAAIMGVHGAMAQPPASTAVDSYGLKIYKVESGLYPFVQVYIRTFDQNMQPLVNLNERNVGVMVKGRSYDPAKRQYVVQSIRNRQEAVRTVFVIDCSGSMRGQPFQSALEAAARFVDAKRPQDQVAVLAIRDTDTGYEVVSGFERDPRAIGRRLADLKPDGQRTRLYDTVAAAMQMCGAVSQGGVTSTDAEYILSNSIVIFSDGKDEGSALSRDDLMTRISGLGIPIPIYSLAFSKVGRQYLLNMEALSRNSFGVYFPINDALDNMTRSVEAIQNILQNDYVITFRAYEQVDGNKHPLRIGLEYPSYSGRMIYQGADFEAIEPPPVERILEEQKRIAGVIPALPDRDPYLVNPHVQQLVGAE